MLTVVDKEKISKIVANSSAVLAKSRRRIDKKIRQIEAKQATAAALEAERKALFDKVLDQVHAGFWNVASLTTNPEIKTLLQSLGVVNKEFYLWTEQDACFQVGVIIRHERVGIYIYERDRRVSTYMGRQTLIMQSKRWYRPDRKSPPPCFAMWFGHDFTIPDWLDYGRGYDEISAASARDSVTHAYLQDFLSIDFSLLRSDVKEMIAWMKKEKMMGYTTGRSAWMENRVSPAQVLGKFFYLCADVAVLQEHLSKALSKL